MPNYEIHHEDKFLAKLTVNQFMLWVFIVLSIFILIYVHRIIESDFSNHCDHGSFWLLRCCAVERLLLVLLVKKRAESRLKLFYAFQRFCCLEDISVVLLQNVLHVFCAVIESEFKIRRMWNNSKLFNCTLFSCYELSATHWPFLAAFEK